MLLSARRALALAGVTAALLAVDVTGTARAPSDEPIAPLCRVRGVVLDEATVGKPIASCSTSSTACGDAPQEAPSHKPRHAAVAACKPRTALYSPEPHVDPLCQAAPRWTTGLRPLDVPVPDVRKLEGWVRFFGESQSGRGMVAHWLQRSGKYRHVVEQALKANHMPRDVVALVFVESGFSPHAVSKAGAVGLWQLMEKTAQDLGLEVRPEYDERRSVEKSTEAATRHLSELYAKFGSWDLAFAAYDLGAKNLTRRMETHGVMEYWQLAEIDGALPQETIEYVPKVLAFAMILKNLDRFGFDDVPIDRPVQTSEVDVPPGTSFGLLARAAGTSISRIRELNPELVTGEVPDLGYVLGVHVPATGLARARVMLPTLLANAKESKEPGIEDLVPDDFDWSKHHGAPPSLASLAKPPAKACGPNPIDLSISPSSLADGRTRKNPPPPTRSTRRPSPKRPT